MFLDDFAVAESLEEGLVLAVEGLQVAFLGAFWTGENDFGLVGTGGLAGNSELDRHVLDEVGGSL